MTVNSIKSHLHIGALQEFQDWILERILPVLKKQHSVETAWSVVKDKLWKKNASTEFITCILKKERQHQLHKVIKHQ